jgi:hypothetical protein
MCEQAAGPEEGDKDRPRAIAIWRSMTSTKIFSSGFIVP